MPASLSADELLSTTRAVRRRLDLTRPVEPELIDECLGLAVQAPNASYRQHWHFVVVTDPELRAGLAALYRRGAEGYFSNRAVEGNPLLESAWYLVEHLAQVPVHVIPCVEGRLDGAAAEHAHSWGTVVPAAWSFMLAARSRGLGTCWTTFHLAHEREAAELLAIPYDRVTQVALIPTAHTLGSNFRPARRRPLDETVHRDRWHGSA